MPLASPRAYMLVALAWFAFAPLYPGNASASLIGDTVECSRSNNDGTCDPTSAVVSGGTEFVAGFVSGPLDAWGVDLDASTVAIRYLRDDFTFGCGICGGIVLEDLDWFGDPTGFISGVTGFNSSGVTPDGGLPIDLTRVSFGPHSVSIDLDNSRWEFDSFIEFQLVTSHSVPEPTTLVLLGLGVLGAGVARRRRAS